MQIPRILLPRWCYSIRMKLVLAISIPMAIISLFIAWFFPAQLEREITAALEGKANAITAMMAYHITPAFAANATLHDVLKSAELNPDIEYLVVEDDSGGMIAAVNLARATESGYENVAFAERVSEDGLTYQTVTPIIVSSRLMGRVYIGFSLRDLASNVAQARGTIAGVSIGIFLSGIILVVALNALVMTPLLKVVKTAQRISAGEWTQRTRIQSSDEVGDLSSAFDMMVDNLERAYRDLRRSEKGYRDLFASNPHPMWVNNIDTGAIIDVNTSALESYGYTREEFLAKTINDIVVEGPPAEMQELKGRNGSLYRSTGWRHVTKDGTVIDVEMSSHPLPLASGQKARLILANDITTRLRAETKLRESEERNRILSEATFEGISLTENGIIVELNKQYAAMLGYDRTELIGTRVFDLICPDDHEYVSSRIQSGRADAYEHRLVRRDGSLIYVEVRAQNYNRDGHTYRMSSLRDITSRKQAEHALLFEKARFEQLFENAPIGIVLCDSVERILHTNSKFVEMFGYELNELLGKRINDVLLPEEYLDEGNAYTNRVLAGEPIHGEAIRRRKNGSTIDVDLYGVPIIANGESVGLFGIYVDTSERKKAERQVRLLAHTVESTKDCVTITDLQDRVIFVNEAFQKNYGYQRDEVLGKHVSLLRSSETPEHIANEIRPTTLAGGWYGEIMNTRKDGTDFPVELWTSVVRNEAGIPLAMVGVARDVTERKSIERKQASLMKELEEINKELNDFAYIVSHDLKAPLRAIGSLADWLMNDYGDMLGNDGNEMLKVLLGRTKRMHDLIDGVLKYSRIGRTKGDTAPVELEKLVAGTVEMIDPPDHINVQIASPLPVVVGEETRLQQVFQNLLSNAVKFMDKPNGKIRIGCERENGHWKFSVADNGPGIEEKHFAKVFQIFQTLAARDEFESTGIGLTIVKKIVELHGGRIWLESEVGKGTTFYFTLPGTVN
ncbi:MAG: PAS domain S-box protein [Bacteroidetes bacterium]|nr:PAS domain S-box protein [Bacteroidota bacterium]MCW5895955.1 PAS domain S-box protein [Bacteroidota bacterium]